MKVSLKYLATCAAAALVAASAHAQAVTRGDRSILEIVPTLSTGQYVWAPELGGEGPALMVVNLATQRMVLFRNGVPVAASTVSTGKKGHETPTGVFTILQKRKEHYSNLYDNAPMPNMQRLTWGGIALHAGNLPGYPASHGCIRLPKDFSALLFGVTSLGMTVVITEVPAVPSRSVAPAVADSASRRGPLDSAPFEWHPGRTAKGIVSVVVSVADQRAVVLRRGIEIGSAPVRVGSAGGGAIAYVLREADATGRHWLRLDLAAPSAGAQTPAGERRQFEAPTDFRRLVSNLMEPGSVVIVTPESLTAGSPGMPAMVIESDEG